MAQRSDWAQSSAPIMNTEQPMKHWVADEAQKQGVCKQTIWMRIRRGKYPHLQFRRVNKRVVYVTDLTP